jgi:uncharacterized membrane protein YfcA
MNYAYNKKHVQVSVSAAMILGMLLGFWIGKRVEAAGVLEGLVVLVTFIISANVVFSRIDKIFLPSRK